MRNKETQTPFITLKHVGYEKNKSHSLVGLEDSVTREQLELDVNLCRRTSGIENVRDVADDTKSERYLYRSPCFAQYCMTIKMTMHAETIQSNNNQWEKLQMFCDL